MARDLQQDSASQVDALSASGNWARANCVEDAVIGADAVLVLTEWEHYRDLNWQFLATRMRKPAWVFDARAVADPARIKAAGLSLWRVGDGEG